MNKKFALLVSIAAVVLALTNPSKDDYISWMTQQAMQQSGNPLMQGLVTLAAPTIIRNSSTRQNYVLFSWYRADFMGQRMAALGIFSRFFPLNLPSQKTDSQAQPHRNQRGTAPNTTTRSASDEHEHSWAEGGTFMAGPVNISVKYDTNPRNAFLNIVPFQLRLMYGEDHILMTDSIKITRRAQSQHSALNQHDALAAARTSIIWWPSYLFVQEATGAASGAPYGDYIFARKKDHLIYLGYLSSGEPFPSDIFDGEFFKIDYDVVNDVTAHAWAPVLTLVAREKEAQLDLDLDGTWEANQWLRYKNQITIKHILGGSYQNRRATSLDITSSDQTGWDAQKLFGAILGNAALAKVCQRNTELGSALALAREKLSSDLFAKLEAALSRVASGEMPNLKDQEPMPGPIYYK